MGRAIPPDPLAETGIAGFGAQLRRGATTIESTVRAYLTRIAALEPRLQAFECVDERRATATAQALDRLLAAGTDLGPLMGVPVVVKDIIAVEGMPTTAGSNVDVADIVGPEGGFIRRLRRLGVVILGKVKTVEFALGASRTWRGTPWNPCDPAVHHCPGGSSSGSAVAMAAGMCGLAIGSDTGGSVRIPAAFCGVFGLKTTVGLWPTDGVFPLARSFDTVGLLTRSAADAAVAFAAIQGVAVPPPRPVGGLRLGDPRGYFIKNASPEVAHCFANAVAALAAAGVRTDGFAFPEADTVAANFPLVSPLEQLAAIGRERFLAMRDRIDPDVATRISSALPVAADDYLRRIWLKEPLSRSLHERLADFDGIIAPTTLMTPPAMDAFRDHAAEQAYHARIAWNTRPGNVLGVCATSLPIQHLGADLPVGLQTISAGFHEADALAVAQTLEAILGRPKAPDLRPFLA